MLSTFPFLLIVASSWLWDKNIKMQGGVSRFIINQYNSCSNSSITFQKFPFIHSTIKFDDYNFLWLVHFQRTEQYHWGLLCTLAYPPEIKHNYFWRRYSHDFNTFSESLPCVQVLSVNVLTTALWGSVITFILQGG